jgi:hypothetical protein
MTIEIPDDLAHDLESIAATQNKSVEEVAVERLRSIIARPTSPQALLQALQMLPHPTTAAVDDLNAAIAASRLPVDNRGVFDR